MVRFDKPCIRVDGAVNYFRQHLRVGDYLSEEGQAEMTWFGEGAARLGLEAPERGPGGRSAEMGQGETGGRIRRC